MCFWDMSEEKQEKYWLGLYQQIYIEDFRVIDITVSATEIIQRLLIIR